jgi:hypothetical protein
MGKPKTLRYIFSCLLSLAVLAGLAQKAERYEVSFGVDMSRFLVPIVDNNRYGWELSGDAELLKDLFAVVELGSQTTRFTNFNNKQFNYNSNGAYTRLGVDYNFMKHIDNQSTDKLFVGLRYGFTTFYHEANQIVLNSPSWGNSEPISIERKWLGSNWLEMATGMRAHLFNNFYLGWSARFRVKVWMQNDPVMQPFHVPGYGRAWNNSWVGFNYSLYYKIPLIKKPGQRLKEQSKADQ